VACGDSTEQTKQTVWNPPAKFGERQRRDTFDGTRRFGGTNQANCLASTGKISEKDKGEILLTAHGGSVHEQSKMFSIYRQNFGKRQRQDAFDGRQRFCGTNQDEL
jgi:hypothetical protein